MSERTRPAIDDDVVGPSEVRDPLIRRELKRAAAWAAVVIAALAVWTLSQPLLIIIAGIVFAALLDGGARLIGKIAPIGRGWRLLIVVLLVLAFMAGVVLLAGFEIAAQIGELRATLTLQSAQLLAWLQAFGLTPQNIDATDVARQVLGSVGSLTSALGSAIGALTALFLIMVIGLFIAIEPKIYDRGIQWMLPRDARAEFRTTTERMAKTLRRLLWGRLIGMAFEGMLTFVLLSIAGVPMALVLGILAGILAFIPNVGAFITGILMVAVGLSDGTQTALYAFIIYVVVQGFDGYIVVPMVARRTVDMPPALTLSAQILFSGLFGILGLALADPIVAMAKAALERRSEHADEEDEAAQSDPPLGSSLDFVPRA